jgi:DNA-binding CsgD family transcriptional regulator
MENPWGKAILGCLAAIVTWKALGPERQHKVIRFLDQVAMAAEQARLARERQEQLFLSPALQLIPAALPLPEPSPEVLRYLLPPSGLAAASMPGKPEVIPAAEPDALWRDVIVPPAVVLVLGKRGSGKSALAYRLLELFRWSVAPYVVGVPGHGRKLLPEWMGVVPNLEELPHDSIALVDEAYLAYHARESMAQENKAMSQVLNLSRQRNQTLIFVAQEARQVDRNIASAASVLIFKELGMLQPEFDRPELRKLVEQARASLDRQTGDKRSWAFVYSPDADFLGPLEGRLPSFWKPSLSRLYAAEQPPAAARAARRTTPQEKAQLARSLRQQGLSYSQIAHRLGVSKSTVANYLKGYPYKI